MSTHTVSAWRCLACPEKGSGATSDRDAERHTKTTKHPTHCWTVPSTEETP